MLRADWLYMPLVAGGLGLALTGARWSPRDWRGWALRLVGCGLCLVALPPYPQVLTAYRYDPEFGPQFYLSAGGAAPENVAYVQTLGADRVLVTGGKAGVQIPCWCLLA